MRDEREATIIRRLHTVRLPKGTMAWIVAPDGDLWPDGPYPAIALLWYADDVRYRVRVHSHPMPNNRPDYHQFRAGDAMDVAVEHRTEEVYEYTRPAVLVLFPEYGEADDPWMNGEYVFFSKAAAEAAAAKRVARAEEEREEKRKEKAINELTQP